MKNDKLNDDLRHAFYDIDSAVANLRTLSWIMNCMADPSERPPEGIERIDLSFFFANILVNHADEIRGISNAAQDRLREASR